MVTYAQLLIAQTERYAVVIHEIMADPTPVVGLPNTEYIELRNVSNQTINLLKWKIDNGTTTATINTTYLLQPDSIVLLCSRTQLGFFNYLQNIIGLTSFPSINNEGDLISIKNADNKTIHAVQFETSWYNSAIKANGGWSLEIIDPKEPCAKNNWSASTNPKGGSPGQANSIHNTLSEIEDPLLIQCFAIHPKSLLVNFDTALDSASLANKTNYLFQDDDINIKLAHPLPPLFNQVELQLEEKLDSNKIYTIEIINSQSCKKQNLRKYAIKTGIPKYPQKGDLVFNEIMFDPEPSGSDFIEVINTTNAVINARQVVLGSKNKDGTTHTNTYSYPNNFNLLPFEYYTFTADTHYLMSKWTSTHRNLLIEMKALPSMPDDDGNLLLMNSAGELLDEVTYDKNMHYPLLRNKEGVALEKINYRISSNQRDNWHSAAASADYGTPTKINSQYNNIVISEDWITIEQNLIHADNNGSNDFLQINYQFEEPGTLLSLYLFNQQGLRICTIINNLICGEKGTFNWNGLNNENNFVASGIYIAVAEAFHLNGKRKRIKKVIAVKRA